MKRWEDLGNDQWKLSILPDDPEDKAPPSIYRGTRDQISEMLADSQLNANRRIAELKRNGNGHAAAAPQGPQPLTPADRLQMVSDLDNPATVDRAIARGVEAVTGETMEARRERREREEKEQSEKEQVDAAMRFVEMTPEWYQSDNNTNTMVDYMLAHGMDLKNTSHYTLAFERLTASQRLQPRPAEAETPPESEDLDRERNAPAAVPPRPPSRVSTGVMQRDISGLPPKPTTRLKYTREQIADLGAGEYKRLMFSDPEFTKCVEYYGQVDRQRERRKVG